MDFSNAEQTGKQVIRDGTMTYVMVLLRCQEYGRFVWDKPANGTPPRSTLADGFDNYV